MILSDVWCFNNNENSDVSIVWGIVGSICMFSSQLQECRRHYIGLLFVVANKIIFPFFYLTIQTFGIQDRLFHTGPCFTKSRLLFAAFWKIAVVVTQTGRVVSKFFLGFFVDLHQRLGHTSQYIVALVQTWFGIGIVLFALHEINVLRPALLSD